MSRHFIKISFFSNTNVIFILANRINCDVYHAGISLNERNRVHENFVKDKLQIVVATVAFGMGIDKPGNCSICYNYVSYHSRITYDNVFSNFYNSLIIYLVGITY